MKSKIHRLLVPAIVIAVLLSWSGALLPCAAGAGSEPWRFAVVADTHVTETATNLLPEMATSMAGDDVKLVLFAGDNVDGGISLTSAQMQNQLLNWRNAAAPLYDAGIGVYPLRGNHEANVAGSTSAWNNVFSGPYALPANGPSGETNLTYSVTCNNALFIGFDEFIPGQDYRVNQAWFDSQLAGNTRMSSPSGTHRLSKRVTPTALARIRASATHSGAASPAPEGKFTSAGMTITWILQESTTVTVTRATTCTSASSALAAAG